AGLLNQNEELADNVQQVNQKMDRMKSDLTVLINPAFSRVIMNSTQDGIVQQAVIYFNPSDRQVYLNTSTLPELSEDQQYQLWALIDGQPVDAGTFDVLKDQFQQMKQFERVDAFAVTIEPKGGSEGPTLEKMQVYGEV
ncbi:MAG: anti-sigma factor, partial [Cyclobacteriaceae bacterium]